MMAMDLKPGDLIIEPGLVTIDGRIAGVDRLRVVQEVTIRKHAVDVTFADGQTSPFQPTFQMEVPA